MMAEAIAQPSSSHLHTTEVCRALGLSRAGYYRIDQSQSDADLELRDQIQQVALAWPSYGYRRITAQLKRQGLAVNRKHVLRLMREDNLLCLRKKRFVLCTTNSDHRLPVYPNLVPELVLNGSDQLWLADITYIRLLREFIYLAVILDGWSRRCIGWALEPYLEAELAMEALRMALATRQVKAGLVHHSDRGVQYASLVYTDLLRQHQIRISMSRKGNAYDNAKAESFIKTLKYEEVYLCEYEDLSDARGRIGYFIEDVYNQKRLHSALGYLPPAEFEQLEIQPTSP
jgi:transposase InsO family protein